LSLQLSEALDLLERTPGTLARLLKGTAAGWYSADEGPGTWTAFGVVGHLIHADETVWLARAMMIREHGESRAFAPGDQTAQFTRFAGWSMEALLEQFEKVRAASLETVRGWRLTDQDLLLRGRHTEFGVVTLGQLLATWAVHDLTHVTQAARVMARHLQGEVGAWEPNLSIFRERT
jgi:hypothetical protein